MSEQTKEINVNVDGQTKELIIRHGQAIPAKQPRQGITVDGTLGIVRERLLKLPNEIHETKNEHGDVKLANSFLKVNRESGSITLVEDAGAQSTNSFVGKLTIDPRFEAFGINSGKRYTAHELADFVKMNRSFFETKDIAMKLVSELRNFKMKVDKQVENSDNKRGDRRILIAQAVDTNVPETFKLYIPIYKGVPKQKIEVEVAIDSGDFSCSLVSPEAADFMEEIKDQLIDIELGEIEELLPGLAIFEC